MPTTMRGRSTSVILVLLDARTTTVACRVVRDSVKGPVQPGLMGRTVPRCDRPPNEPVLRDLLLCAVRSSRDTVDSSTHRCESSRPSDRAVPTGESMSANFESETTLAPAEAHRLLRGATIGRIVFTDRGLPAVQPVNFTVVKNGIIIRTASGSKLDTATRQAVVAFEVDEIDAERRAGWSVVVVGRSSVVTDPLELARLAEAGPRPWANGLRDHFIRVEIDLINGRRVDNSGRSRHVSAIGGAA